MCGVYKVGLHVFLNKQSPVFLCYNHDVAHAIYFINNDDAISAVVMNELSLTILVTNMYMYVVTISKVSISWTYRDSDERQI